MIRGVNAYNVSISVTRRGAKLTLFGALVWTLIVSLYLVAAGIGWLIVGILKFLGWAINREDT